MADTRMNPDRCQATAKGGSQCGATARPNRPFCLWHDDAPDAQEKRRLISQKGGQARSNKARAKKALPAEVLTAEEIRSYLGIVFRGVISGKIEPGVGTAAAGIARALLDVAKVAEVEEQVAQLWADMAAFSERRSG
jgi:hypothetical protein